VIFVTERQKVKMIDDYKALGVIGIIYKPLEPKNLRSQIEKLWQERSAAAG
jgi:AmiR/NasT family two-component response regulator